MFHVTPCSDPAPLAAIGRRTRAIAALQSNQLRQLVAASLEDYLGLFRHHALQRGHADGRQRYGQQLGAQQLLQPQALEGREGAGEQKPNREEGRAIELDAQGTTLRWSQPAMFEAELALESGEGHMRCPDRILMCLACLGQLIMRQGWNNAGWMLKICR